MAIRMRHPTSKRGWVTTYYEGRIKIIDGEIKIRNPKSIYILSRKGWQVIEEEHLSSPVMPGTLIASAVPPPKAPEPASTAMIEAIEIPTIACSLMKQWSEKSKLKQRPRAEKIAISNISSFHLLLPRWIFLGQVME